MFLSGGQGHGEEWLLKFGWWWGGGGNAKERVSRVYISRGPHLCKGERDV